MAKRQSMTEKVLEALREDIINWVYEENDMITEAEISEKFGVSKTPSREALNYLCMEGFLDKIPNKGYLVRGLSVAELQSLFQFRGILEKASVELAIQYAGKEELEHLEAEVHKQIAAMKEGTYRQYSDMNMQFHMSVAYLSRNPYLISTLEGTLNKLRRVLGRDWKSADAVGAMEAHLELVEALKERDVEKARAFVDKELSGVEYRLYFHDRAAAHWQG